MKVCVVTNERIGLNVKLPLCDVALFGFGALGQIDYAAELSGATDKLERLARLSSAYGCGVFSGCVTVSRGIVRRSVAAASGGKLLGISDMMFVFENEQFKSGAAAGVYAVNGYKVGLCIGNDLYFPEHIKTLAHMGCNLICAHMSDLPLGMPPYLIRSYAYLYGVPIALSCANVAYFADITGVIASCTQEVAVFETSPKSGCRAVSFRRRGLLDESFADY